MNINSISLASAESEFRLLDVPPLPLALAGGATSTFRIEFAPTAVGSATDTLRIDDASFTLSGTGNQPEDLPGFRYEGPSGAQPPRSQPAIGLTLDSPYPLRVRGTLTLAFTSDGFTDDPSVQFATGGRTVDFTIEADGTQAVFPNNTTQVRIQTGTVAGTITVTPSFATDGGTDLTPEDPLTQVMSVAAAAPQVTNVVISQISGVSLTLEVTGFSTPRSVTRMDLSFNPVPGEDVSTRSLSLNVESSFTAWYQNTQSRPFGSQFTASVTLELFGDVNDVADLVATIDSISVTLTNAFGTSDSMSVLVP